MSYQRSGSPKDGRRYRYRTYHWNYGGRGGYSSAPSKSRGYPYAPGFYTKPQGYPGAPRSGQTPQGFSPPPRSFRSVDAVPVPTRNYKDISYAGNVGDRAAVGNWGLPPIAQSYDHRPLHQHGGGTHGQASVDSSSSSHSRAGDKKSQATDEADDKHQRGYSKSSDKQRRGSSHDDRTSSHDGHPHEDPANSRDAHTSSRDIHAHGDKTSFTDSHSRDGDGKKSARQKSDGDRKAGKLSRLNLDVVLQDEQLTNLLFAGISKATAKLEQSLKTTDKKLENYASTVDSTGRHKTQQSVQTSSAEGPQKPKSIMKRKTREERVDVESKVSTESQASSDSFSKLSAFEKTLHLLCGKTNVEDVVRRSEKGSRGSKKPSFKPVGTLSQLESYNDSGDDYDHAEKDTKKQTKTKKNAPSTQPFWFKMDQLSQQTGQTDNLASFSQTKKAGDNNEEELDSTVQNILQSIGFNFDLSKRPQELARQKEQQDVLHTGMINQSASFLGQSNGLVKGVRAAVFGDKQKKAQPDSLNKETGASMQKRPDHERWASGDTFSAETQSGKNSYSRKGKNPEPDIDRSRMDLGSHEIRSDRRLENLQNIDWEQISPDEDEIDEIESRQIEKMKTLPHEKHAEVRQRSFSKERNAALSPHDAVLLDEAWKSKDLLHGSHEKSLRLSERFRDEPKDENIYQDVSKSIKTAALLAALCSKQNEVSSSGSKSLKLPLQSGSAQVENLRVTSRTVHSDDNKNNEPYIESRKMSLPSKSDVRIVSHSPVFRKSQSPEMKVPRKRPASPLPCPVSKEKEDRVLNEKRSFSVLQAFLKTSFEKNAPGFCQEPGLNVVSCDKLPLLQTLLGGLNVGRLPAAESTRSPVMSDHFVRDIVRKSPDRPALISADVRTSRSPGMSRSPERHKAGSPDKRKSVSPDKQKSTSLDRRLSRSPDRRSSRLPDKMKSKSPNRQMSRSPVRRKSSLPGRRVSKSPDRRKSIASSRRRSRSPDRHRLRSPYKHGSRSPDRRRSRSPHRRRSRSPGKRGSRSPKRPRATSIERSKSKSPHRLKARSPVWTRPRSPARYKSKSPGRYRSQSTSQRRSGSPGRRRICWQPSLLPSQAILSLKQQLLPAGQQNLSPQVQTFNATPPLNQQMLPTGQQNFASQVQTSYAIPPVNQQMWPAQQQNLSPQAQKFNAAPPLNQQMLPTGQQNFAPQVQTFNATPPVSQQMWPAQQQNLPPQVQTFNATPPLNQQMLPGGQQNFAPRTAAPNWPAAQNWQLPQYQRQNVYRDTNTTIINTYNMIVLPAQENIPTMYEEDWEELPAAQSKEFSEEQKKEPLKEQPKEQVQELPNVQEKEQQNQDLSESATKNNTKLEVDIFEEFPIYERKIIFKNMALMNTAERQKLAQDLSQTQTKLAELKAEMAKLVKEQNEIMQRTDVVDANLPELTQNKKAQANLTEEVGRLLKASNYIPEKTQVSGERQFMIPKLKTPQIKKQKPLATGNSRVSAKRQKLKGKLTGSTKPWLSKSANQNMAKMSPDDHPVREDHKDTNTGLPVIESVTLNEFITTCLYDTGLQFDAIVATSLVNPDQVTDEIIKIQVPLKGSVPMLLPVAKVNIISHYVTGEIRAAVLDDPIYPVILGCCYVFLGHPVHPMIASAMSTGQQAMKVPASTPTNSQPEEFKQAQAADSTLAGCFRKLPRAHSPPYTGQMFMKNGFLHRSTGKKGKEHAQLIVPSSYRAQILDMGHILSFSGHVDINATMQRISTHYFWPGMNPDIVKYVKSCPQCQRVAPKSLVTPSTLGKMGITNTPFEKVAVDIVGPLRTTERKNCYILTLVDTVSMWAEAVPMPSSNSKHVAEALLGIFNRLGFPLRILTDNGSIFSRKLMEEVFRLFQSQQIHMSPYHLASNGTGKQFNGTLVSILKKLAYEQPERWDTYIPAALSAYRDVPHDSTGIAPATLLFRRPIKGPLEVLLRTWTDDQVDETIVTAPTYVAELNRLQHGWKLASDNLQQAQHKISHCYKKKDREFEVGEKVLLLLPTSQNKLQIGWKGPYEVTEKISCTNYNISILGKQKICHINLLKKYNERPTTETAHLMTLAEATEVDHENTMSVEYPLQAKETYLDVNTSPTLTQDQLQQIQDLLATYAEILTDKPGLTDLVEFDMKLNDPTPVRVKTYPVPYAKATALKDEIQKMLSSGIISPSESPYSASVVLLRKPSGENRLCIDYRQLNAITEFQAETLPDQSHLFTSLSRAKYFTRIDISKGYYQIPVKPEVRPWLAFSTPDGHYEFNVVPFGLSNTPSVLTHMMRKLLDPLHHPAISNFMDDILIATETFEEHSKALQLVFKRLKETGFTARPKKCQIGFQQLDFLGHTISQGFMTPLEGNIEKLQQAPCPRTKEDVTSFVSLCGCYQRYIKDFNSLTAPLTNLARKEEPENVIWSAECDEAYSALKMALTTEPVLHLPDLNQPLILRTDASNIGIGATLLQRKEDEHSLLFPVAYASRKLNTAERNYSTIEKECLALVWAVEKFQAYLYGKHFTVQCDHQPLMFLAASGNLNARLMRWSLLLQPYSFQIEYIPAESNVGADFLSRHPVPDTVTETKEKGNQEEEMD